VVKRLTTAQVSDVVALFAADPLSLTAPHPFLAEQSRGTAPLC